MSSAIYESIKALQPRRSKFDIGYEKKFDCDMGQLIPVFVKHVVPGDFLKLGVEAAVRGNPSIAPYFADLKAEFFSFFVPYRILFGKDTQDSEGNYDWEIDDHAFEKFLSGGRDGKLVVALPRWTPTGATITNDNLRSDDSNKSDVNVSVKDNGIYSLWDYLEFPVGVIPQGASPLDFSKRAYNLIWDTWFRDENYQDYISVTDSNKVMNCCWKKDYFTSALPWQQRGIAPGFPVSGVLPVSFAGSIPWSGSVSGGSVSGSATISSPLLHFTSAPSDGSNVVVVKNASNTPTVMKFQANNQNPSSLTGSLGSLSVSGASVSGSNSVSSLAGSVNLADAVTFNVSDLRLAVQIQKWLERNARSGYRMREFLLAHFGVAPRDETLQRPQFIGGYKAPVIVSEVLQTSQTTSGENGKPLGDMAGHSLSASVSGLGDFHVNEFGLVMTLMTLRPKASYQQGIDKEWLYRTKYDFYFPEFAHLSEQAVEMAEVYAQNTGNVDAKGDPEIFGYQGRYNELRKSTDKVCGGLRSTLDYWHLGRTFGSKPELNSDFVKCNPSKRVFAVLDEPAFICNVGNICTAYRPLPAFPDPSL